MTNHPGLGLVDVFAATLPTLKFSPGVHVNYAETVLPMRDGLPKLKDFPKEFGGSGEAVPVQTSRLCVGCAPAQAASAAWIRSAKPIGRVSGTRSRLSEATRLRSP